MESCLKCVNSACCRLVIETSKQEYDSMTESLKSNLVKYSDEFIAKKPRYESKRDEIDEMYEEIYAYLPKSENGLCKLLDRETMLCSMYDQRPKVCRDYELNRCEKIREICTD